MLRYGREASRRWNYARWVLVKHNLEEIDMPDLGPTHTRYEGEILEVLAVDTAAKREIEGAELCYHCEGRENDTPVNYFDTEVYPIRTKLEKKIVEMEIESP